MVYPNIDCSTKQIYSKVKKFNFLLKKDLSKIQSKSEYSQFLKNETNDLQSTVEKKHPQIKKILNLIKMQKKCLFSRITGSGSVCFGAFPNQKSATLSLRVIKKKLPNCWCVVAKSI